MTSTDSNTEVWDDALLRDPHIVADKRNRVRKMFAAIAPSYDLNNRLHSLWMDQSWRKKAVKLSDLQPGDVVLDVACGTGDLTLKFARKLWNISAGRDPKIRQVIGLDFTYEMLPIARQKSAGFAVQPQQSIADRQTVLWLNGDAMRLPLPDQTANVISIAFGIRNVADPAIALQEFYRVLRPGGRVLILEFSLPSNPILRGLYNFYFRKVLPRTATLISGDKTGAYKYLPESVNTFIGREKMMEMMRNAGFEQVENTAMTFGICVCYRGLKR